MALCSALIAAPALRAQSVDAIAGLVVRGTVTAAEARWDATRTLFTYLTVDVAEVLVGTVNARQLVIKQLGGETDGIGLYVPGQAAFRVGEDVLLDLAARGDGSLHTVGLARGKWTVVSNAATGALEAVQPEGAAESRREPLAVVTARLRRERAPLVAPVAVPREFTPTRAAIGPHFAYLPTDNGYPARWHEVDDRAPVFVDVGPIPGTWTHASGTQVSAAITLWRGSGMELDLRQGGAAGGGCPSSFTGNGRITVTFNDPCGVTDWVVGGGYYTIGDLRTVGGTTFQKFVQGLVVLDDSGPQATSTGCFQDAVTHGLGHALGLGHTNSGGAIMNAGPPANCASGASGLGADDVSGITSIYRGIPSATAPPDTPTAFSATAQLSTATFAWTPATTGGAVQRFLIDAGTAPGTYNLGTVPVNAPTTSLSVGGVPAGTYYLRIKAQNALGTSAPTSERTLIVGGCTAPGAPPTFTGSANGQQVAMQWSAPSGVVQGYRLIAGSAPGLSNLASVDLPAAPTAFAATAPFGTYYLRVHATNVCGVSPPSPEITLVVQPCSAAPSAPTGLAGSVVNRVVTLSWTAPATGAAPSTYVLSAGSAAGASDITVYNTGNTLTSIASPAPPGRYFIRAAAANACGTSGASNEVQVVVP